MVKEMLQSPKKILNQWLESFQELSFDTKAFIIVTLVSFILLLLSAVHPYIHLHLYRSPVFN